MPAVAGILGAVVMADNGDDRHIAIDGKILQESNDADGRAEHVLSAFCGALQTILSHEASRGKRLEIPDALKLLARLDLRDRIVTGDAIFCQKAIAQVLADAGGDYLLPVKNNQKTLRENIETAFVEPVFLSPLSIAVQPRRMDASGGAGSKCCRPQRQISRRIGQPSARYAV